MIRKSQGVLSTVLILCLLISAGCEPLRKKFIREKNKNKPSQFVPVLDPVDYPAAHESSKDRYDYHYSLWAVWERDLIKAIDEKVYDKKLQYTLSQEVVQLEEMKKYITESKAQELGLILDRIYKLQDQIVNKPAQMRNMYSIKQSLEAASRDIRHNFKPGEGFPYKE